MGSLIVVRRALDALSPLPFAGKASRRPWALALMARLLRDLVPCINRSPVRRPTPYTPRSIPTGCARGTSTKLTPLSRYPLRVPPPPLQRLARKTDRTIRVPPRAHLCLSCTRIERRREVSHVWPACSLRLTIPQTWAVGGGA